MLACGHLIFLLLLLLLPLFFTLHSIVVFLLDSFYY